MSNNITSIVYQTSSELEKTLTYLAIDQVDDRRSMQDIE